MTDPKHTEWLLNEIREELNVKEVILAADDREHVDLRAKPNFKVLGKRLGSRVKDLAQTLADLDQAALWSFSDTGSITLAGETFSREEILLDRIPKPGRVVASEGGLTVILDTTRTPELEQEGWAREFAARIQAERKALGLGVSTLIRINLRCEPRLFEALFLAAKHSLLQDLRCQVLSLDTKDNEGEFLVDEIDGMTFHYQVIPC